MADNRQRAEQLIAKGNKLLVPSTGLFGKVASAVGLVDQSKNNDDAIDLFTKAANFLRMDKAWSDAGKIFKQIAELQLENGTKHDAAQSYLNAANSYRKCSDQDAVDCLLKVIEIYTDLGRFSIAAKHHISVAEIYEQNDIPKTIEHYSKAADYYQCEESNSTAMRCLLNVARHAAMLEQYEKAIEIYENAAQSSLDNNLLKYGAKEYFLRAALCHLCIDYLNAQIAVKKYEEMSPAFSDSRECKFVKELCEKIEAQDQEAFAEVVSEYDSISRLDQWYTTLLLRTKNKIASEDDCK